MISTVAAIRAILAAAAPLIPIALAILWAGVGVAILVLCMADMLACTATILSFYIDHKMACLRPSTTVRGASVILSERANAVNRTRVLATHL